MKYLRINSSLDAHELEQYFGKVALPTAAEIQLANLVDETGDALIKVWLEPSANLMNASQDMIRNRADLLKYKKRTRTNGVSNLSTLNGEAAIETNGRVDFLFDFPYLGEWTIFAIAHATPTTSGATSSAIIGAGVDTLDADSFCPTLIVRPDTGELRMFKGANVTARLVENGQSYLNTTHLYAITLSQEKGISIRVDGVEKKRSAADTTPSNIGKLRWLGHYLSTGGHSGKAGTLIATNKDLTKAQYSNELKAIELFLMNKYGL